MNFWIKILIGLLIMGAIGWSYGWTYNRGVEWQKKEQIVLLAKANKEATESFDRVWELYVQEQAKKKASTRIVKQEVEKIVEREVYKNVCIDSEGLEIANKALRGGK